MSNHQRLHICADRPPYSSEFCAWLLTHTRSLAIKVVAECGRNTLRQALLRWRVLASSETSHNPARKSVPKSLEKSNTAAVLRRKPAAKAPRSPPLRTGSKSHNTSPDHSFQKHEFASTLKVGFHTKTKPQVAAAAALTPTASEGKLKRPSSVPPGHEKPINTVTHNPRPFALGEETKQSKPKLTAVDVGTRLFLKAQEIEWKKEEMKRLMEPGYTFQPRLAQNTEKWLNHKSAKTTPVKARGSPEEIAVVSSSTALGSLSKLADLVSPTNREASKLPRSHTAVSTSFPLDIEDAKDQFALVKNAGGYRIQVNGLKTEREVTVDFTRDEAAPGSDI